MNKNICNLYFFTYSNGDFKKLGGPWPPSPSVALPLTILYVNFCEQ